MNFINTKGCPRLSNNCLAMNSTHNGVFFKYPDVCNCCDYCVSNLGPGENCMRGYPGSQPGSISVCGHELECIINPANGTSTCQRMQTKCITNQDDWDKRRANGNLGITEVRPKCDSDGLFAPFHCIPGSICYCISPEGKRIFGEIPFLNSWDEQTMTCGCALNDWKMQNTLDVKRWNEKNSTGALGARCKANGQFDSLQCMLGDDAKCFCVDPMTGRPNKNIQEVVNVMNIREGYPTCFDPTVHKVGKYDTPCESLKMSSNELSDYPFDNPICQPDGMFHRLQTMGSKKICVDPSGKQITHDGVKYEIDFNTNAVNIMDCNCARNIWLLSSVGVSELPKCCSNGNFQLWQCRRNVCFCVDNNGDQIGLEVNNKDILKLSCYNPSGQPCPN
ncbi:hypothetical protein PV325_001117 [Microctonus aethiopoides]|nr:hypothetical protein PV325_001117 [Microctonus aethiopoides]